MKDIEKVMKSNDLRVYLGNDYNINFKFEKALREFLKSWGYESWASGIDMTTGIRDICFEIRNQNKNLIKGHLQDDVAPGI